MGYLGFVLLLLGAGGMDSQNQIVPSVMFLLGLAIISVVAYKEYLIEGARR